jgi:hypothetical protein
VQIKPFARCVRVEGFSATQPLADYAAVSDTSSPSFRKRSARCA